MFLRLEALKQLTSTFLKKIKKVQETEKNVSMNETKKYSKY